MSDTLLTMAQAAKKLGCNPRSVRRWCLSGRLRSVQVSPRITLVREDDLRGFAPPQRGNPNFNRK